LFELDELSKAIFIQNSLIATWAIAYSMRMFLPYSSKYNLAVVIFRSTVTILNGSAMLMMIFYEGINDCSPGFTIFRFFLYWNQFNSDSWCLGSSGFLSRFNVKPDLYLASNLNRIIKAKETKNKFTLTFFLRVTKILMLCLVMYTKNTGDKYISSRDRQLPTDAIEKVYFTTLSWVRIRTCPGRHFFGPAHLSSLLIWF
jgi:hypothetical protein